MGPKESGAMKGRGDSSPTSPRKQAAADAGLSPDQAKDVVRVSPLAACAWGVVAITVSLILVTAGKWAKIKECS